MEKTKLKKELNKIANREELKPLVGVMALWIALVDKKVIAEATIEKEMAEYMAAARGILVNKWLTEEKIEDKLNTIKFMQDPAEWLNDMVKKGAKNVKK